MAGIYSLSAIRRNKKGAAKELEALHLLGGKDEAFVKEYLLSREMESLLQIDLGCLKDYRTYVDGQFDERWKTLHYAALLEIVALACLRPHYRELCTYIEEKIPLKSNRCIRNKVSMFLMVRRIETPEEITYYERQAFEDYLNEIGFSTPFEALKMLDQIKLFSIEEENDRNPLRIRKLSFANEVIYLGYHPDYKTAMEFYYLRDKKELAFDFSLAGSEKLKRQILAMLNDVLSRKMKRKNRREMYLVPLKKLYLFSIDQKIDDLEQLTAAQVEAFRQSMDGKVGTKTATYMEIVYSVRRFLFLSANETNWDANVWFMDRFELKNDRKNPANYTESFRFDRIENDANRYLMKQYMKYEIGIGARAVSTILGRYIFIMQYLQYCDKCGLDAADLTVEGMDRYVDTLQEKNIKEATFNGAISSIDGFYRYLAYKKLIPKIPFEASYYIKKTVYIRKDRSVSEENQISLLTNLKHFPEPLRLMCLNIWATGVRVNEICSVKGGAYSFDGQDAYLTVTQYKQVSEKQIPIPKTLYDLMSVYIRKNGIGSEEYVFKSKCGGAYQASTFRVQVQRLCKKYGIGDPDYIYRPHDFRHGVATQLFDTGASLQAIRDYHGHRDANMTCSYIDYMPRKVDKANAVYFKENTDLCAGGEEE